MAIAMTLHQENAQHDFCLASAITQLDHWIASGESHMPNQKTLPLPEKTEKCLNDLNAKRELLTKAAILYSRELSEELVELWDSLLASYSASECEYAFDYHMRNGKFFPKPADILETIRHFRETNALLNKPERYPNHGKGYGENDVKWILHKVQEWKAQGRWPLTEDDRDALLEELDRKTGRAS